MLSHLYKIMGVSLVLSVVLNAGVYAENDAAVKIKWGYKGNIGPSRWAELDPQFALCGKGKQQSPINIIEKNSAAKSDLQINYTSAPLDIGINDTTKLQIGKISTLFQDGHGIEVNFPADLIENIVINNETYQLIEFHIHTPSENTWHGQSFPAEIHFVHQGPNGKVAVLGVFAKGGEESEEMQIVVDNIPHDQGQSHLIPGKSINPADLLPANKRHYRFQGSLTTPPCSEGLQWFVFAEPITISPAQIARLRHAVGGSNARPVQPLNGRSIYSIAESKQSPVQSD
ncbi:MAG: carbonic anhydrase family protein [Gammaproteobacteria bacterium]|nr:carbonic anhydrase family protein [Gammaproteobacteria bacterium]